MSSSIVSARSGRVQTAAVIAVLLATLALAVPLDPSGDLDPAFSGDGRASANFSSVLSFAEARGVAIQSTGKMVLGGSSVEGGVTNHFALIRLHTDGTQDMSFGAGGVTKTPLDTFDLINDVAVQSDDKIVAIGFGTSTGNDFIIARYTVDGALDTSFASPNGFLRVDFEGLQDRANAVVIQDDQKIVVGGWAQRAASGRDVGLVRLNTNGTLDGTFGTGGKVMTAVAPGTGDDRAWAVVMVGSGAGQKILAGGRTRPGDGPNLLLAQYTSSGALDGGFGTGGIQVLDIPANGCSAGFGCGEEIRDLALQSDGKIVATGGWTTVDNPINRNPKSTLLTARCTASGAFDTSFDGDGWVITSIVSSFLTDFGESVAVQADGKIVSFGWSDQSDPVDFDPADHDFLFVRLNSNGSRDGSYGTGGPLPGVVLVELSDGNSFDDGDALVLDSSGRAVGVGLRTTQTGNSFIGAARLTTAGALDTTFGPDGPDPDSLPDGFFNTQLIGGSRDEAGGMAVQTDGKTLVAGWTDVGSNSFDFALARFNTDGTLDPSFGGGDGLANATNGTQNDTGRAVALQSDGKIVVAGDSYGTLTPSFTLMRFTTAGVLDVFAAGGVATTTFGTNGNTAYALAIQTDGKILAGGSVSDVSTNWDFGLARFFSNGIIDTTFGAGGKARFHIGAFDEIHAILVEPDGKIVVGGRSSSGSHFFFVIARYHANGSLDTTFASPDGYRTVRLSHAANPFAGDEIRSLVRLPDGRIVAGGKALNASGLNAFALARFNPDGSLDTTLDGDGTILANLGGDNQDEIHGIALQFDEKIVAFGSSFSFTTGANDFGLARFNWDDGSLDATYGTNGVVTTDFAGFDRAAGGAVVTGGKATAGGTTGGNDFAAARYLGDPAPTVPGTPPGTPPDLAPGSDRGISIVDDVTNDATPTFLGGCVTGETVVLRVDGAETVPRSRTRCVAGAYATTIAVTLPDGVRAITAFSINGAGASAVGAPIAVTIDTVALPPTISAPAEASTVNPNPAISGGGAEPAASVTVREGAAVVCTATADGTGAWSCSTTLLPGGHTVTATQTDIAGNTSAASAARTFAIKAPTTTALTSSVNLTVYGQPVTFTATVSSAFGTPDGAVDVSVDGGGAVSVPLVSGQATLVLSNLIVGAHSVTASYPGATLYFPSADGPLAHTVNKAGTSTNLVSSANPSVFGQSVTLTATVAAVAPGGGTPTGAVTFKEGTTALATVPLDGSGQAALTSSTFPIGPHAITAEYGGDANFNISGPTGITQTVDKANSSTTVVSSANPSVFGQSVTFTATVTPVAPGAGTPTGTVTFEEGTTTLATVTLDAAGQAEFTSVSLAVGPHDVTAEYGGDANFNSGSSPALTQNVNQALTDTALVSSSNPSAFGQSVTFTATVSVPSPGAGTPAGNVTFIDGAVPLGSVPLDASLQAAFTTSTLSVGPHPITAEYGGDASFASSVSPALSQTVTPSADLSVTKDDGTSFVEPGSTITYTIVVTNHGPSDVAGGTVTDLIPAEAINGSWTCAAAGGGVCTPSGAGDISDSVDLPSGASATYSLMVDLVASPSSSTISNTASAAVPAGHVDPDSTNDTATDVDTFCLDPLTGCGNFYTVTPCRVADTRNPAGPSGGPALSAGMTRSFPLAGVCGIPLDARVVAVNVTVVNPTALGALTLYPAGSAKPLPRTIAFSANQVRNNNAVVGLGASGQVDVTCDMPAGAPAFTHFVLDVTGYFK